MKNSKLECVLKSKKIKIIIVSIVLATTFSFTNVHATAVISRFNGVDRYDTAAKVCQDGWKQGADYVVLVNGENFPDSLSAAPLAKKFNAPILLTTGTEILNPYSSSEIGRLKPKNAFIIGGKSVVSQSVEDSLKSRGIKVTRIGGKDRYETGVLVAQKIGKSSEVVVVNGNNFQDGLSIASIAALKGMPIVLTERNYIPAVVQKYLKSNAKSADQVYVVGEDSEVSDAVVSSIPNSKRVGSGDIYERNAGVIEAFQNEVGTGTLYVASAKDFPDSLVAAALAPATSSPILFVSNPMSNATYNFLRGKIVNNIKILGGTGAVDYDTEQVIESLPLQVSNTNDISDVIWQNDKYNFRPTVVVTATDGSTKEVPVTWNLTNININKPGIYTINGTIDGTSTIVTTTLIVKPIPVKIADINKETTPSSSFSLPETVPASMSDGTTNDIDVNWDYSSQNTSTPGVYTYYGTCEKYNKKVKLTLVVKDDGSGTTISRQFDDTTIEIVQGDDKYKLPTTVLDKVTNKKLPVTWNTTSIDTSKTGIVRLTGTVTGSAYNAYLTLIVTPKIVDVPKIDITKVQGEYYTLPTQIDATTSDGKTITVDVAWNTPFADLGTPQTYYIKGTVKHYDKPVLLVLKVVSN